MRAKLALILCQYFILSSATDGPTTHATTQTGSATAAASSRSGNSSTASSSPKPLLTTTSQNRTATSLATDVETSPLSPSSPTALANISDLTSTMLPSASVNSTQSNLTATTLLSTPTPNITLTSPITWTAYSPNVADSSQNDNATSTASSPLANNTVHTPSPHTIATNGSFTSREPTALPNSTGHREVSTAKPSTVTSPTAGTLTTVLSPSSPTAFPSNSTGKQDRIATPSGAGTALTVIVCLVLVAVALLGLVMYLKKRRVFYSRLQEDTAAGSWSNYNNPAFEDL